MPRGAGKRVRGIASPGESTRRSALRRCALPSSSPGADACRNALRMCGLPSASESSLRSRPSRGRT
eukprot:3097651-Alexandrium_andersonii.AAC.1